jgi:hypothetical protein
MYDIVHALAVDVYDYCVMRAGVVLFYSYAGSAIWTSGARQGLPWQSINGKLFPTQCGGCPDKRSKHTHTRDIGCMGIDT